VTAIVSVAATAIESLWLQHLAVDPLDWVDDARCGQDVRVAIAVLRPASKRRTPPLAEVSRTIQSQLNGAGLSQDMLAQNSVALPRAVDSDKAMVNFSQQLANKRGGQQNL